MFHEHLEDRQISHSRFGWQNTFPSSSATVKNYPLNVPLQIVNERVEPVVLSPGGAKAASHPCLTPGRDVPISSHLSLGWVGNAIVSLTHATITIVVLVVVAVVVIAHNYMLSHPENRARHIRSESHQKPSENGTPPAKADR